MQIAWVNKLPAVAKKCKCARMYKSYLLDVVLQDEEHAVSFGHCVWKRCWLTRQCLKKGRKDVLQKISILMSREYGLQRIIWVSLMSANMKKNSLLRGVRVPVGFSCMGKARSNDFKLRRGRLQLGLKEKIKDSQAWEAAFLKTHKNLSWEVCKRLGSHLSEAVQE